MLYVNSIYNMTFCSVGLSPSVCAVCVHTHAAHTPVLLIHEHIVRMSCEIVLGPLDVVFVQCWWFCFKVVKLLHYVTNMFHFQAASEGPKDPNWWKSAKSIYEFSANDIDGNEVSLEKYR